MAEPTDWSQLINEGMKHYIARRRLMVKEIRQAFAEANADAFLSDEESEAFMRDLAG